MVTKKWLLVSLGICLLAMSLNATAAVTDPNIITGAVAVNGTAPEPLEVVNGGLIEGELTHVDRTYVFGDANDLAGIDLVRTAVDDKTDGDVEYHVTVDKAGTMFLIIDNRVGDNNASDPPTIGSGVMDWAATAGFVETGYSVALGADYATAFALDLAGAGTTVLEEQNDGSSRVMYLVAAIPAGWNLAPSVVLNIGSSVQVPIGDTLAIDTTVMDYGENTTTSVLWQQTAGEAVDISPNTTSEDITVSFPGEGEYTLKITATDGDGLTTSKTVNVSVQIPTFAIEAFNWCQACNDPDKPATAHVKSSRHYARNHSAPRRRIEYIHYDISGLKGAGEVFANSYLTMNRDKGSLNEVLSVYAVNEDNDNFDLDTGSWSNLPGVDNTPVPDPSVTITEDMLDQADITPLVFEDTDIPNDVWYDTPASAGLDELLNADDDGVILLMFVTFSPEDADFEIRSPSSGAIDPVTGLEGIILRGNIMTPTWATEPTPAINTSQSTSLAQLSWTNPTGVGNITCDVYIGTGEPNYLEADYGYDTLGTGISGSSVSLSSYTLAVNTEYNWIVDCTDDGTAVKTQGYLWTFDTDNAYPTVEMENDFQYLWLNNDGDPGSATAVINATASDDGFPNPTLDLLWEQLDGPATVTIDPNDVEDITLVLPATGTYTFQLSASDGDLIGTGATEIFVGATPCDAAKAKPEYVQIIADFDENCYVDLVDLSEFAIHWLECNAAMDAPCVP